MTTFSFGGTDLSTFGNITMIDSYLDIPERRGNNRKIAFRHGTLDVNKYYDEREISFGIAIKENTLSALETKLKAMQLLFSPMQAQTLSITYEDGTTKTVLARVEKQLQVRRIQTMARVVVDFMMATPFFRLSTAIADNTTTINANPKAMTVTNPGTIEERDATIILTGPLSNTVITNSTNGCVLTYTGTIASPRVVTISTNSTGEYVATNDLGTNVIGNITHSGASALMVFNTGDNTLSIADATHTTGTVKVTFSAPYL